MRKVLAVFALLLAGSGVVYADSLSGISNASTPGPRRSAIVFNNSASTLTSGTVVVWNSASTNFTTSQYPYVTTTTTADDPWTAGVVLTGSCTDQNLCEIVTYGPVPTLIDDAVSTAINTMVGTSAALAGQADDYVPAANTCALGMLMQDVGASNPGELDNVFVNVNCQ